MSPKEYFNILKERFYDEFLAKKRKRMADIIKKAFYKI
jgi:hypothetical protein